MVSSRGIILRWVLKPRIFSRSWWSNPVMTLMTMISTATPSVTPSTEIEVMTETKVLLGRRYRSASSSSNGNRDMRAKLNAPTRRVNASRGKTGETGSHRSLNLPDHQLNHLMLKPPHTPKANDVVGDVRVVRAAMGAPRAVGEVAPIAAAINTGVSDRKNVV